MMKLEIGVLCFSWLFVTSALADVNGNFTLFSGVNETLAEVLATTSTVKNTPLSNKHGENGYRPPICNYAITGDFIISIILKILHQKPTYFY